MSRPFPRQLGEGPMTCIRRSPYSMSFGCRRFMSISSADPSSSCIFASNPAEILALKASTRSDRRSVR